MHDVPLAGELSGWRDLLRWKKLKWCFKGKFPRPDGFLVGFFQEGWEFFKEHIFKAFKEFCKNGVICSNVNKTFLCLIPKKDVREVKDFWPISLVSSLYKLIA